ncbi:MAG: AMP-binding protein, partial [Rhodocyclales bacterium]|nr:AMP-binding protein [Rhodocyclales bacterium]
MSSYTEFYQRSIEQPDAFWGEEAKLIDWHKPPQKICDYSNPPFVKWFSGGETNLCYNAVDRHAAKRPDARALIFVSTETNVEKIYSFAELKTEVMRMAAVMQSLGVTKGDRVLIYMPMIAEATFAILACARIGAIHSVVFGGFSPDSLSNRIQDCDSNMLITSDEGLRGGRKVP